MTTGKVDERDVMLEVAVFPDTGKTVPPMGAMFMVSAIKPDVLDFHDGPCTVIILSPTSMLDGGDDELARTILRPVRGCVTDSQWSDALDRAKVALATVRQEQHKTTLQHVIEVADELEYELPQFQHMQGAEAVRKKLQAELAALEYGEVDPDESRARQSTRQLHPIGK